MHLTFLIEMYRYFIGSVAWAGHGWSMEVLPGLGMAICSYGQPDGPICHAHDVLGSDVQIGLRGLTYGRWGWGYR